MTMEVNSKYGNDLDTSIPHSFCSCCAPSKSGVSRAESHYIHPASSPFIPQVGRCLCFLDSSNLNDGFAVACYLSVILSEIVGFLFFVSFLIWPLGIKGVQNTELRSGEVRAG